jgi:hypothetical protein
VQISNTHGEVSETAAARPFRRIPAAVHVTAGQPAALLANVTALLSLFYLLIAYGRLAENFLRVPHAAAIAGVVGLIASALTGGLVRAAGYWSGRMLILLSGWIVLCIPFSLWRGGSFDLLTEIWAKSVALYLLIAGNVVTSKHYRWVAYAMTIALVAIVSASHKYGTDRDGRFALDEGSLANPNDFAAHLLIAAPFLLLIIDWKSLKSVWSWAALSLLGAIVLLVLRTGSRAGLLTLGALFLYRFLRGSLQTKALFAMLAVAALLCAPYYISAEAMERYLTFFGTMTMEEATSRQVQFAAGSATSRVYLLKQSLFATATHPVFGVGPGSFASYIGEKARSEGHRGPWSQTHNTFTQMSAECGLLAGILYIALVIRAFRNGRYVWKLAAKNPAHKHLAAAGEALATAVVCFVAAALFGNYAYMLYAPFLAGCGEALRHMTDREAAPVPYAPAAAKMRTAAPAQARL